MKKKSIIALILAASLSLGVAAAAGCNTVDPNGPGNQTENEGGSTAVTGVTLSDSAITLTLNQNGSKKLTATVSPSNATDKGVVWTSDNKAVATVDQNGNVTAVSRGTAVITVTTSNGLYADTCTVTVNESQSGGDTVSVTGVSLDNNTATMTAGGTKTLTATITPSTANNKNLTWSSDKPNIATVDQNGKVTAVAKGTAIITVTTEDGGHKATCTVTVEGTTQNTPVSSISIGSATATLDLNGQKTKQFSATVLPATATVKTVTWKSSNTSVVTVDQNGLATAKATGTATITATADDGSGVKASCSVTVTDSTVVSKTKYTVDFYSDGVKVSSQEVEEGKCATIPSDVKKDGYYISGWGTSSATGANYDFTAKVTGNLALHAKWEKVAAGLAYSYAGNECAAFEWGESNPAGATVKYKLSGGSYENVDSQLIRSSTTAGNARVDIVGLKGGATYDFEITTSANKTINVSNMQISAYDRSGYAHFNYTSGVGGYNDDGTPKSNAAIVYFTESNKNDTVTVHGKSCTGIVGVLTTKFSKPVIIRVIGTVGAATWNKIDYNESGKWSSKNKMPKSEVKGINGKAITGAMSQAQLISGGYNTLNEDDYAELLGLSSNLLSSSSEFDSCWNDCSISGAKDVTIEGIGEDARIFQWGMTFKNSNSIEVRNLTFEDYTEDACSFEGGSSNTSSSSADGFTYKNFWIHHNTFEEGVNYWDVCSEQDKHDGDGSTDIKRVSYVTFAYNIYHNTHKTGLVGSDNNIYTAAVTFHHNLYDTCKARLPLARQANMHMYNNYYKGTTSTDISLRGSAYALVENCYFEGGKAVNFDFPYDDKFNGANGNGWAKVIGCKFTDSNGNNINPKTSFGDSVPTSNFNLNVSRTAKLNTTNKYGADFDTDSSVFYYDSATKTSRVENMLTAEQVKTEVPKLAGVQKHTGTAGSGGSTGGDEHQHTYADTYTSAGASGHYKMATCGHSTEHTQLEPHVYDNATDTTCNECNYVRTIGGNELIKGDPSTLTEGALAAGSTQTFNGFKLYGSSKVTVTAGNNKITYNGKEYSATKYISLGGGADFSGNETCIEFTVTGNCKVTVASRSSGTAARTLKLVGGTEELTIDAPDKGAAIGVSTVSLSSGTYKIGSSSGGINVYYIIVEYLA